MNAGDIGMCHCPNTSPLDVIPTDNCDFDIGQNTSDDDYWIFATLETLWDIASSLDGTHPVSGNRQFGYTQNTDGSYTFYTRGVDKFEDDAITLETAHYMTGFINIFAGADSLWESFQEKINDFVNDPANGGEGQIGEQSINRPQWNHVEDVLLGRRPISDLGCD